MTREEQIDAALRLLRPPNRAQQRWRDNIDAMLSIVESGTANSEEVKAIRSRQSKAALKQYLDALEALRTAHRALDPAIKRHLSLSIESETATAKAFLRQPSLKHGRAEAKRERAAVGMAFHLLEMRGHKPTITRNGTWDRLSMVLADSEKASLIEHIRAFKTLSADPG